MRPLTRLVQQEGRAPGDDILAEGDEGLSGTGFRVQLFRPPPFSASMLQPNEVCNAG